MSKVENRLHGVKCPVCGEEKLEFTFSEEDIPHFGRVALTSLVCSNCGYKHTDVFLLEERGPVHVEFIVENVRDLNTRVVKSSTASVSIPELEIRIDPGPASQGYITNIEGILLRVEEVLRGSVVKSLNKERKVEELLDKIHQMREGKMKFKLIIEDPKGNSTIISERAETRELKIS